MLGAPRGSSRGKHLVNVSNKSARPAKGVLSEGTPRDTRKRTVSSSDNFAIDRRGFTSASSRGHAYRRWLAQRPRQVYARRMKLSAGCSAFQRNDRSRLPGA